MHHFLNYEFDVYVTLINCFSEYIIYFVIELIQ